jgi:nicotinamide-nucleotide amidase
VPFLLEYSDRIATTFLFGNPYTMNENNAPIVSLLMTGSELMSGDTIDSNSAYIAQELLSIGLSVEEITTIGDNRQQLADQIQRLSHKSDLLIINGGLGPTQDDLTAEILASVANSTIETHTSAREHIIQWCLKKGFSANEANLKQAELPKGCSIFPDAPGSAPAFYLVIDECMVIATPGVPSELKAITQQHLLSFLRKHFSLAKTIPWQKIQLLGIGESRLQQILNDEFAGISDCMEIGFRARFPTLELKYKPLDANQVNSPNFKSHEENLLKRIDDFVLGTGNFHLPEALVTLLREKGKTFSCAESCTGGLIASEITKIPGASSIFPGSIVSYSNSIKQKVLHVPEAALAAYGAVSAETVLAMLEGILLTMDCDIGVAVSGIAGPEGGTAEKPAGTVWIAWGNLSAQQTVCLHLPFERKQFQALTTMICLSLVYRWALGHQNIPAYLTRWQL